MTAPHREGSFVQEVRAMLRASVALIEPRYTLSASFDGYEIAERGSVIVTVQGPQFGLASKILRLLQEEDSSQNRPCADAQERSPQPHNLLHKEAGA